MVKLDHIAIIVSKLENLKFYEAIGFRETWRKERARDTVVMMESEGWGDCGEDSEKSAGDVVTLEVFVDPNHPERLTGPEQMGLRHVGFSVGNLDEMIERLQKNGIPCEEVRTDWFGRRFTFVKDFDGQPVEIKERVQN